jgi:hypothetical protein
MTERRKEVSRLADRRKPLEIDQSFMIRSWGMFWMKVSRKEEAQRERNIERQTLQS